MNRKRQSLSFSGVMRCVDIFVLNKGLGLIKEDRNGRTGKEGGRVEGLGVNNHEGKRFSN